METIAVSATKKNELSLRSRLHKTVKYKKALALSLRITFSLRSRKSHESVEVLAVPKP